MSKDKHSEKDITIYHNIAVDTCMADEIERLNNMNGIFTLSSCCGHGKNGYIIVAGSDIKRMIDLGYNMVTLKYLDNDTEVEGDRIVMCAFRPKSKCIC